MDAQWHVIGNSDPANIFFWEQLQEWYPDAKWIVIKRDFEQTFKSCQRAFELFDRKILWAMADKLQDLIRALNPPVYDFDSIRATTAKLIATQCGVKVGSPERVSMLSHMNVQVESKYLKSEIERFMHEPPTWARETAGRI